MNQIRPIDVLRRYWWIIVIFTIAGGIAGAIPSAEKDVEASTRWRASHTILVAPADATLGYADPRAINQLQLRATTGEVPQRVADVIDFEGNPATLASQVEVTTDQQVGFVRISTTQPTADRAVEIANGFADELINYTAEQQDEVLQARSARSLERLNSLRDQVEAVEVSLETDPENPALIAERDALQLQLQSEFTIFNQLQLGSGSGDLNLTTLERAQPVAVVDRGLGAPQSRTTRAALGAFVGALLGAGIAWVLARVDRKVRSRDQAETIVGVNTHVAIPVTDSYDPNVVAVVGDRHDPLADGYRRLRSILGFVHAGEHRTEGRGTITLVTSAGPGDGKTSLVGNLANAFGETGGRTVAVNSDFRRARLHHLLRNTRTPVVSQDLLRIEQGSFDQVLDHPDGLHIDVLDLKATGSLGPGDLARAVARSVPHLADQFDHVVIDTSPVAATAEVLELVPLADTIVIVVRLNHTSAAALQRTVDTLQRVSSGVILLALVGDNSTGGGYQYYYDYGSRSGERGAVDDTARARRPWRRRRNADDLGEVEFDVPAASDTDVDADAGVGLPNTDVGSLVREGLLPPPTTAEPRRELANGEQRVDQPAQND